MFLGGFCIPLAGSAGALCVEHACQAGRGLLPNEDSAFEVTPTQICCFQVNFFQSGRCSEHIIIIIFLIRIITVHFPPCIHSLWAGAPCTASLLPAEQHPHTQHSSFLIAPNPLLFPEPHEP